jgi:hypothetical protein
LKRQTAIDKRKKAREQSIHAKGQAVARVSG